MSVQPPGNRRVYSIQRDGLEDLRRYLESFWSDVLSSYGAGLTVGFRDRPVGTFRADLVIAKTVLVELKALPTIERDHIAQTISALRATGLQVGLILNFGPKAQMRRVIFTRKDEAAIQT